VLVRVLGFGSVWRHRLGRYDLQGRFAQPVYYNTTGILVNGTVRQRPRICGYARFDAVGGFDPNHISKMVGRVFECAEPSVWMGYNKLLFRRILKNMNNERPDRYLLVVGSELVGRMAIGGEGWRSPDTWLLSFSECGEQQEALLLMASGAWMRGGLGQFALNSSVPRLGHGRLVLCSQE
jgi:hypothetical protein